MSSATRALALVPARGASKRLPRKNILLFAGRPMLAWTVAAAIESGVFDSIVVSTDDEEIAVVAHATGATVLMRHAAISDDKATLVDVVRHALINGYGAVERFCLLLANCPLRNAEDIRHSEEAFRARRPPALLSVVHYGWTAPFRAQFMRDHKLHPAFEGWTNTKSQLYPEVMCPSGAIYWSNAQALGQSETLYIDGLEGFLIPWYRGIDIDTPEDLALAACIRHSLDHGFCFED